MRRLYKIPVLWELRKLLLYSFYTCKAVSRFKRVSLLGIAIVEFPIWWKYLQRDLDPLTCDRPWFNFKAKTFLDSILDKDMIVFEYGSGSSTLYFTRRVNMIYSLENDREWYENIKDYLSKNKIDGIRYTLREGKFSPGCILESKYGSESTGYKNSDFEEYVKFIDSFPEEFFDIIVVDGRSRNACIRHAIPRLKKNGYLILDNSERKEYLKGNEELYDHNKWNVFRFIGPIPYAFEFSQTSFFQKRYN